MTPDLNSRTASDVSSLARPKSPARPKRRARGEATELACSRLMRLIETMSANARLPGLRTLRDQIGVSQGTLNAALDKLEQKRILLRRERSGVFVAPYGRRRNVCLICSVDFFLRSNVSPFWQLLLDHMEGLAKSHETHMTIAFANAMSGQTTLEVHSPLPVYLREEIQEGNFDGIFALGLPLQTANWIESCGVPVVAFAGTSRFSVTTARTSLAEQGVVALASAGCKKIALWLPPRGHWLECYPYLAATFSKALAEAGVPQGEIVPSEAEARNNLDIGTFQPPRIENGWEYAHRFFGPDTDPVNRPDGIILSDDMLGLGVLMAFGTLGIVPGRDVQIACYANAGSPILLGWQDKIYRIEYNISQLVEMMFETLEALMDNSAEAIAGTYIPPFVYDEPEFPVIADERYRLIRPQLIPPTPY